MSVLNPSPTGLQPILTPQEHHGPGNFITKYIFSTDHKIIAIQFLFTTLLMMIVGGALALAVRWQLAFPWESMPIVGP